MKYPNEFREFLKLLISAGVDFTLIGGYAVAFHGFVRYTGDIDLFYRLTQDETWSHRVPGTYEKLKVSFISLDDLIRNKRAAGRTKDLRDLEELE